MLGIERKHIDLVLRIALNSPVTMDRYRVGAMFFTVSYRCISLGYTGELYDVCHAEEACLIKSKGKEDKIYGVLSTMLPCLERKHGMSCQKRLSLISNLKVVYYLLKEPNYFYQNQKINETSLVYTYLMGYEDAVLEMNKHFF